MKYLFYLILAAGVVYGTLVLCSIFDAAESIKELEDLQLIVAYFGK